MTVNSLQVRYRLLGPVKGAFDRPYSGMTENRNNVASIASQHKKIWLWVKYQDACDTPLAQKSRILKAIFVWPWNENAQTKQKIERFDWLIERTQTPVAFGCLSERSGKKKLHARERSRNQPILRFDIILQHDWPIEQCLLNCLLHIRVFFGGKTYSSCFDLFIHWLIKQITLTETTFHGHTKIALFRNMIDGTHSECVWEV